MRTFQNMHTQNAYLSKYAYLKRVFNWKCVQKTSIYQNVRTQNAYLTRSAYSKCVLNRKVKNRLNRSKLWNFRLNLKIFVHEPCRFLIQIFTQHFSKNILVFYNKSQHIYKYTVIIFTGTFQIVFFSIHNPNIQTP